MTKDDYTEAFLHRGKFICDKCGQVENSYKYLRQHKKEVHAY